MTTDPDSIPTRKVLCIEDDPGTIMLIRKILEQSVEHVEVLTAQDGITGLELAARTQPDLILLDDLLPDLDGFEVLERLKRDPDLRHIPVFFHAGQLELIPLALELGTEDSLAQPLPPSAVAERIARLRTLLDEDDA